MGYGNTPTSGVSLPLFRVISGIKAKKETPVAKKLLGFFIFRIYAE